MRDKISHERLKELLEYSQDTGIFVWRNDRSGLAKQGVIAGGTNNEGYRLISIDSISYKAHRLAWLYVNGEFPKTLIDHINGNRDDNRISNLRLATDKLNGRNRTKLNKNNKSGYAGVSWHPQLKRWWARIRVDGKNKSLGTYHDPAEAHKAYLDGKKKYHIEDDL